MYKMPRRTLRLKLTKAARAGMTEAQYRMTMGKDKKKAFAKAVTRIVRKGSETKYVAEQVLDAWSSPQIPSVYTNFNSPVNTNADWYRCLPLLTQGDDSFERIGNQVKPLFIKTHLNFKFDPTSVDNNARDIFVVVYVGHPKGQNAYNAITTNSVWDRGYDNYLDNGNGTETSFGGTWTDAQKKIANENFTVKAQRIIRLYKPAGYQNTNSGLTSTTSAQQTYNASTTIVWKGGPNLKYTNSAAKTPNNFAHCFGVGYYYADGTSPDSGGGLLKVSARNEMWYKDD